MSKHRLACLLFSVAVLVLSTGGIASAAVKTASAGGFHTLALKTDGSAWGWGYNEDGELGRGDIDDRWYATQINNDLNWDNVGGGVNHSVATKTDGSLWTWGYNGSAELGLGDYDDRLLPTRSGSATDWAGAVLAPGYVHTLVVKKNGTLWGWGQNGSGELGLGGSVTEKLTPTRIGTAADWKSVAVGVEHSVALKTDGTLWTWGANDAGQLGLGDTAGRSTPTQMGSANDWAYVAAGGWHTLAIKTDGTLWVWGSNDEGQLGLNDLDDRLAPTQVGTTGGWAKVDGGSAHSLAIKTDKTLWTWGHNLYGELGLGDTDSRLVPTKVGTFADWQTVSASVYHSVATRADQSLWTWGSNIYGQIGIGDDTDYLEPIDVWLPETRHFQDFTGSDRYQTAIMISKKAFPAGADYAIVCKGDNFPDALAAAPLAAALNAPVIITPSTGATVPVINELKRLRPGMVYFIGLPDAVQKQVMDVLRATVDPDMTEATLREADRYATARRIAIELQNVYQERLHTTVLPKVVIAAGDKFPDALSAATLAAANGWPILLTPQAGPLPPIAASAIEQLSATEALVVGTQVALPAGVTVDRLVGADRYETNVMVAEYALDNGLDFEHTAFAKGDNYPDALVAAPYLVQDLGMLLLTRSTGVPQSVADLTYFSSEWMTTVDLIGLPPAVKTEIKALHW